MLAIPLRAAETEESYASAEVWRGCFPPRHAVICGRTAAGHKDQRPKCVRADHTFRCHEPAFRAGRLLRVPDDPGRSGRAHARGASVGKSIGQANLLNRIRWSWRKRWDSNPRWGLPHAGFQDQSLKPLGHTSGTRFGSCRWRRRPHTCRNPILKGRPPAQRGRFPLIVRGRHRLCPSHRLRKGVCSHTSRRSRWGKRAESARGEEARTTGKIIFKARHFRPRGSEGGRWQERDSGQSFSAWRRRAF